MTGTSAAREAGEKTKIKTGKKNPVKKRKITVLKIQDQETYYPSLWTYRAYDSPRKLFFPFISLFLILDHLRRHCHRHRRHCHRHRHRHSHPPSSSCLTLLPRTIPAQLDRPVLRPVRAPFPDHLRETVVQGINRRRGEFLEIVPATNHPACQNSSTTSYVSDVPWSDYSIQHVDFLFITHLADSSPGEKEKK